MVDFNVVSGEDAYAQAMCKQIKEVETNSI